jgi:hypothetical protein
MIDQSLQEFIYKCIDTAHYLEIKVNGVGSDLPSNQWGCFPSDTNSIYKALISNPDLIPTIDPAYLTVKSSRLYIALFPTGNTPIPITLTETWNSLYKLSQLMDL